MFAAFSKISQDREGMLAGLHKDGMKRRGSK